MLVAMPGLMARLWVCEREAGATEKGAGFRVSVSVGVEPTFFQWLFLSNLFA